MPIRSPGKLTSCRTALQSLRIKKELIRDRLSSVSVAVHLINPYVAGASRMPDMRIKNHIRTIQTFVYGLECACFLFLVKTTPRNRERCLTLCSTSSLRHCLEIVNNEAFALEPE